MLSAQQIGCSNLFRRDNQYHLVLGPLKDNLCAERIADEVVFRGRKRCQNKSHQSRDFANLSLSRNLTKADMSTAAIKKVTVKRDKTVPDYSTGRGLRNGRASRAKAPEAGPVSRAFFAERANSAYRSQAAARRSEPQLVKARKFTGR